MFWKWAGKEPLNTEFSNLQCISPKSYLSCVPNPKKHKKMVIKLSFAIITLLSVLLSHHVALTNLVLLVQILYNILKIYIFYFIIKTNIQFLITLNSNNIKSIFILRALASLRGVFRTMSNI